MIKLDIRGDMSAREERDGTVPVTAVTERDSEMRKGSMINVGDVCEPVLA